MANNTFIKLFQASENPDKQEELQSVQYAEQQILDEDTSQHEDGTQIIIQQKGKISRKDMVKQNFSSLQQTMGAPALGAIGAINPPRSSKNKSKSLGKISNINIQD